MSDPLSTIRSTSTAEIEAVLADTALLIKEQGAKATVRPPKLLRFIATGLAGNSHLSENLDSAGKPVEFVRGVTSITRAAFENLTAADKMNWCLMGGKLVDSANQTTVTPAERSLTRAAFSELSAARKSAYCIAGGKITD
jgi:hypothetical protein